MTMYSKNGDYPVTRDKFPHLLKDSENNDYTAEHAFRNRRKLGWWDVSDKPEVDYNQTVTWKPNTRAQTWWEINTNEVAHLEDWSDGGRERRNNLLTESDWSQIIHEATGDTIRWIGIINRVINESERQDWEIYRQELRDLPSKYPNFNECIWPKSPVE